MGSIPTHRPSCQTWTYRTNCRSCNRPIWVLQCTCDSAVLFDSLGWPWPEHDCGSSGGIGGSGLSGWAAVDILRANAVPIDPSIMQKAFTPPEIDKQKPSKTPAPEQIRAVQPKGAERVTLLAVIRDLFTETKRTRNLK